MISDSKVINFGSAMAEQARSNSIQSIGLMASVEKPLTATLVADPTAGTKQIPPEDAHPEVLQKLKIEISSNLQKILATEAQGVASEDYAGFIDLIDKLAVVNSKSYNDPLIRLRSSRGQLADVVNTNAVHTATGNQTTILSGNDIKVFRSLLWRGGTAMRCEAPLITDNAHTRLIFAHTLLQQADLLTQRAQNMLSTIKGVYAVSASDITLLADSKFHLSADTAEIAATTKIKLSSQGELEIRTNSDIKVISQGSSSKIVLQANRVDINPTLPVADNNITVHPAVGLPTGTASKVKKHVELPQWEGMSPIPAYVFPGDELDLQNGGGT